MDADERVPAGRLPSVAQGRLSAPILRSLHTKVLHRGEGNRSGPDTSPRAASPNSLPSSRPSSRHSFEGIGHRSVWTPSPHGAAQWERKVVSAFDRSRPSSRQPSPPPRLQQPRSPKPATPLGRTSPPLGRASPPRAGSAARESLGGQLKHPMGSLSNPVPTNVQAEVRRLEPLVRAAEEARALATLNVKRIQETMMLSRHEMMKEVEAKEEEEVRLVFDTIDLDGNGTLDRDELNTLAVRLLHRPLSDTELDECMEQMDDDGGGDVDFEEFLVWWKKSKNEEGGIFGGLFTDVLDGSDGWVRLKMELARAKDDLKAKSEAAAPLVDELQRLLAIAGWHFRVQADTDLRTGPPGWTQSSHAGFPRLATPASPGRESVSGGSSGRSRSRSRLSPERADAQAKARAHARSVGRALREREASGPVHPMRTASGMKDAARPSHRLGLSRRPRLAGEGPLPEPTSGQVQDREWSFVWAKDFDASLPAEEAPMPLDPDDSF